MADKDSNVSQTVYDFKVNDLDGKEVSLETYRGHVLLIVNVASHCGLTKSNYNQLNELYAKYESSGLRILAFPCNQFGNQEPGCTVDIKEFMVKHGVKFDVFEKINVNGNDAHPLWKYLKKQKGGTLIDAIKWNFTKFLINKKGEPVSRYAPTHEPKNIEKDILAQLALD